MHAHALDRRVAALRNAHSRANPRMLQCSWGQLRRGRGAGMPRAGMHAHTCAHAGCACMAPKRRSPGRQQTPSAEGWQPAGRNNLTGTAACRSRNAEGRLVCAGARRRRRLSSRRGAPSCGCLLPTCSSAPMLSELPADAATPSLDRCCCLGAVWLAVADEAGAAARRAAAPPSGARRGGPCICRRGAPRRLPDRFCMPTDAGSRLASEFGWQPSTARTAPSPF